ncbi:MAG TPA: lysylphosphatidylglycerol synthase transmembrane domain-containing protein [bacterium]|nr:lysylphosphatidylglycerol synthase transmembrane domain-containing protein [bacterium]HOL48559.1 lysylphosphatidylglycerol synthase transmembrane domain-containing protein [bacterium]HPQ19451.1 lysylphosphatidylglycerol synthase transmembrane domain-containing protein [bacterium]
MINFKNKKTIIILIKIFLALFLIIFLITTNQLDFKQLFFLFNKNYILIIFFICSIGVYLVQFSTALRLFILLTSINYNIGILKIIKYTFIGSLFNMILPINIGGDIVKGYYIFKNELEKQGRTIGILIIDRLLGLLSLFIISICSIIYLISTNKLSLCNIFKKINIFSVIIISSIFLFLFFLILYKNWLECLIKKITKKPIILNLIEGFTILTTNKSQIFIAIIIGLFSHLITLICLFLISYFIDEKLLNFIQYISISAVVILIGNIPLTPGNIGWLEFIGSIGWQSLGSNNGALTFFIWRIIYLINILIVYLFFLFIFKKEITK